MKRSSHNCPFPRILAFEWVAVLLLGCSSVNRLQEEPPDASGEDSSADADTVPLFDAGIASVDAWPGWRLAWVGRLGGGALGDREMIGASVVGERILLVGWFMAGMRLGEGQPGEQLLASNVMSAFLAAYDLGGRFLWVRATSGSDATHFGIDASAQSGILTHGYFRPGTIWAAGTSQETTMDGDPDCTMIGFVARHGLDGTLEQVVSLGTEPPGPSWEEGCYSIVSGVTASPDGGFVATGIWKGRLALTSPDGTPLILETGASMSQDGFVAAFDGQGHVVWIERIGSEKVDDAGYLTRDEAGTVYLSGRITGAVVLGRDQPTETTITPQGFATSFLAAYDASDGALCWATDLGGPGGEAWDYKGANLGWAESGALLASGGFSGGSLTAGCPGAEEEVIIGEGNAGGFVAAIDPTNGQRRWRRVWSATRVVNDPRLVPWGLAQLASGELINAGIYAGQAFFGRGEAAAVDLESPFEHGFVALLSDVGELETVIPMPLAVESRTKLPVLVPANQKEAESVILIGSFYGAARFGTGGGDEIDFADPGTGSPELFVLRLVRDGVPQ